MPATTLDRRVRRTRRNLSDALIGLILERGYDRITVQDVLDRADVGRSTFYAHFRDKEALLLACFDGLEDELREALGGAGAGVSGALFEHAYRHRRVYRALCGRGGGAVVRRHLHTLVAAAFTARLRPEPGVPAAAAAEFHTAAVLGLLFWWVGRDFPEPPAAMAAIHDRLATRG